MGQMSGRWPARHGCYQRRYRDCHPQGHRHPHCRRHPHRDWHNHRRSHSYPHCHRFPFIPCIKAPDCSIG